jgi:hypothetical protein
VISGEPRFAGLFDIVNQIKNVTHPGCHERAGLADARAGHSQEQAMSSMRAPSTAKPSAGPEMTASDCGRAVIYARDVIYEPVCHV